MTRDVCAIWSHIWTDCAKYKYTSMFRCNHIFKKNTSLHFTSLSFSQHFLSTFSLTFSVHIFSLSKKIWWFTLPSCIWAMPTQANHIMWERTKCVLWSYLFTICICFFYSIHIANLCSRMRTHVEQNATNRFWNVVLSAFEQIKNL